MLPFVRRLFSRQAPSLNDPQLAVLMESLKFKPEQLPLAGVFPLFAPAAFFDTGQWPGPYQLLQVPDLGFTWAIEQPQQTMLYLSRPVATYWESAGVDWRLRSLENLERRSQPNPWTGHLSRDGASGESYALVFMQPDGYGPSRLLLERQLRAFFPQGYLVALPEMSCAIALASDATASEREKVEGVVNGCYTTGTRPLVPGLHDPRLLAPA